MNYVILLYGKPASGKFTVAKELSKIIDGYVLDNHFFNNIIFPFVKINSKTLPSICQSIYRIKDEFLDSVSKFHIENKSYIFTSVLMDTDDDRKSVEKLMEFSDKISCRFIPIELVCCDECVERRINTEERKNRNKLTNINDWKFFVNNTTFMNIKDHYEVNTSYKTIEETVKTILKIIDVEMKKSA